MKSKNRLFCYLMILALLICFACGDPDDNEKREKDTPEDPSGPTVPLNPNNEEEADNSWGLWFGVWDWDRWTFEQVPTPATISPRLAAFNDGAIAVLSARLLMADDVGGQGYQRAFYLSYRFDDGTWIEAKELVRLEPGSTQASIAAGEDNQLHVLFSDGGEPVHLIVKETGVASYFPQPTSFSADTSTLASGPDGRLHAVFGEWGLSHQVFVDEQWSEVNTFERGSYPSLKFGPEGSGHLVFLSPRGMDFTDGYLLMHYALAGNQWVGGVVMPEQVFYPSPQISVDYLGRTHILAPSAQGLLYLVQDKEQPDGWYHEVVAGDSWRTGLEYCDIITSMGIPIIAYRDAATAKGYAGWRPDGDWELGAFNGFEGGFVGIDLTLNMALVPNIVFSGWKVSETETPFF